LRIRTAGREDAEGIGRLHARSWQSAYRGILRDDFLDGPVAAERAALWQSRMTNEAEPAPVVVVAEDGAEIVGLACILPGHDSRWGSLIDNLHVAPDRKRAGLGRRLLAEAASCVPARFAKVPLHLTVLRANTAAQAAYDSYGGEVVEALDVLEPDGGTYPVLRYRWDTPAALLARLSALGT
jgi:ribosomal protein S18 acetylase RimI-like enzyme